MEKHYIHSILSNLPLIICAILIMQKKYSVLFGLTLVATIVHGIKKLSNHIPKDSIIYQITRRPENGVYCGMTCFEKKTSISEPGFPSGHTAFITFYALCLPHTAYFIFMKVVLVLLVSYNRIQTGCHTLLQVIGGMLFGGFLNRYIMLC
jgi:membrane-associated phospholipid phosphatase